MQLIDQRLYPAGETYRGDAAHEIDHFEFLKTYSVDDATNTIISSVEQAADQEGYTLLIISIYYEEGLLYHLFDVNYKFTKPEFVYMNMQDSGTNGTIAIQPMIAPIVWVALINAIVAILTGIFLYILINKSLTFLGNVFYEPGGGGDGTSTGSMLKYAVIFIAAAYLINAFTGASKEIRRY